jgi:hypothetical protein
MGLDKSLLRRAYAVSLLLILVFITMNSTVFVPEDGGGIFLRNVGGLLPDYMALRPRRLFIVYKI